MFKKEIKSVDFNGEPVVQDYLFHLSKAELLEMELSTAGGVEEAMNTLIKKRDGATIMSTFKELILKSYGEKSADGLRFVKSPELSKAFEQTDAYSELFCELVTNPEKAAEFFNNIIPRELAEEIAKNEAMPKITSIDSGKN